MLPKTITDRYELYKQGKLLGQSSAKKGVYIDKKRNSLVFVKMDTNVDSLFREYGYQKLFYKLSKGLENKDVIIPKPLKLIKARNLAALVMEYFPGESLLKVDIKTRVDAYTKVLKFLEKINKKRSKKSGLLRKSAIYQFATIPYFLSKNLTLYFPSLFLFFHSYALIMQAVSKWNKLTTDWICHGDINVTNLLFYKRKIVILDFASVCLSHRYLDLARTLNSTWYQKEFQDKLWDRVVREFRFTKPEQNILKSFIVFNLLQRLSQRYNNLNQERFYIKRLEKISVSA